MRAAWYEKQGPAAEVLQLGELPDPQPGSGEVRVRVVVRAHDAGRGPATTGRVLLELWLEE
jgi:NADPH:quinone reductase